MLFMTCFFVKLNVTELLINVYNVQYYKCTECMFCFPSHSPVFQIWLSGCICFKPPGFGFNFCVCLWSLHVFTVFLGGFSGYSGFLLSVIVLCDRFEPYPGCPLSNALVRHLQVIYSNYAHTAFIQQLTIFTLIFLCLASSV